MKKIIDKFNEFWIDQQLKRQFKPNKKQMKKEYQCKYCGNKIPKGLKGASFGVDMTGNISDVICLECSKLVEKAKESRKKKICPSIEPSITYCFHYCEKREKCFAPVTKEELKILLKGEEHKC